MTLVFFKAMRPYDKTNGFFENYFWYKGVCGPMSIKEAQRLNAAMGGRIETIDLPHITSLEQFLEIVGAENASILNRDDEGQTLIDIAGPLKGQNDPQEIIKKHLDSNIPKKVEDEHDVEERPVREKTSFPIEVILNMDKTGLEALAKSSNIELPAYVIQFKELNDAKKDGTFDSIEHIGTSRNVLSIMKAYIIMKMLN